MNYCLPNEASYGTIIRLYVLYMEKNPKKLDDLPIVGMLYALADAYPCPVKPK